MRPTPDFRAIERTGPNPARIIPSRLFFISIAVKRDGKAVAHHFGIYVQTASAAENQQPAVNVVLSPNAGNDSPADQLLQRAARGATAIPLLPLTSAGLIVFRSVDPQQSHLNSIQTKRIAVDDLCKAGLVRLRFAGQKAGQHKYGSQG